MMVDLIILLIGAVFFYWLVKTTKSKKTSQETVAVTNTTKPKGYSRVTKLLFGLLIVSFVAGIALKSNEPPPDPQAESDLKDIKLAYAACKIAFEKSAHDPKSVEWIRDERQGGFKKNKDGTLNKDVILNMQPVRAKNKLGALVRSNAICEAHRNGDSWSVYSLSNAD